MGPDAAEHHPYNLPGTGEPQSCGSPAAELRMEHVSFRIQAGASLLAVRLQDRSGWLLACHERWQPTLGTRLCRHLGALRWVPVGMQVSGSRAAAHPSLGCCCSFCRAIHQKGVNLTDVRVEDGQEFAQVGSSLDDVWQIRSSCESGRVVALQCSGTGLPSARDLWWGRRVCAGGSGLPRGPFCPLSYRWQSASGWTVHAGVAHGSATQEAGVLVERIISHPLYNDNSMDYDIALMKLRVPLNFSDAIGALCLLPSHQDLLPGTPCWVSGWGYTRPDQAQLTETLKEALVPLISTQRCNSSCMYAGELTARMLCAGYQQGKIDACQVMGGRGQEHSSGASGLSAAVLHPCSVQGDSGGALVCQDELAWRLVGIVSWGRDCAEPNRPGVYTNVPQLLPWIYGVTEIY
ncbi:transmembrane protease serine 5 [Lagopus muta]|uniref:transmembrane protease serine 5 n=1 Tax=Lagopus muta TaxID=64668 RepID=UPI00209C7A82|nr:transmembrane protease serine 5 [Lagopus muta]